MIRKNAGSALLAAAVLQASLAHGLGLGDITLRSALDQPLQAEIRLRGVGDLSQAQILVGLGSASDFDRAGVERLYLLTDIRFDVQLSGDGDGVVRLSTDRPIREPYLDFVVEVRWPTGRVLREYTMLLDLPTYTDAAPETAIPAASTSGDGLLPRDSARRASVAGDYAVASGDTLWGIANRARPSGVSVQRMMVAIQRNNPDAFIRGNINLLKSGHVLSIPDAAEVQTLSEQEAVSTVSEQDRDWRGEAMPAQGDAASGPSESAAAAGTQDEAYLKLAGDTAVDSGAPAAGGSADVAAGDDMQAQLSATQEGLSAAERENLELKSRVAALEEQVETFEKLVDLKTDPLAGAQDAAAESATAPAPPAPAPEQAVPAAEPEPALLDRLLGNMAVLGGIAGALLLGMLVVLFKRRRTVEEFVPAPERPLRVAEPVKAAVASPEGGVSLRKNDGATAAAAAGVVTAGAAVAAEPADPVGEAEIYLAYGRSDQAIDILNDALRIDGSQTDVRLKLMEIHAERGDEQEFLRHFGDLGAQADEAALESARELLEHSGRQEWLRSAAPEPVVAPVIDPLSSLAAAAGSAEPEPGLEPEPEHELPLDLDDDLDAGLTLAGQADEDELQLDLGELDEDDSGLAAFDAGADEADLDLLAELADEPAHPQQDERLTLDAELDALALAEPGGEELELGGFELDLEQGLVHEDADLGADDGTFELADELTGDLGELDLPLGDLELGGVDAEPAAPGPGIAAAAAEPAIEDDADLDFLKGTDEVETKLELAQAYVEMGDLDGARDILDEVISEGSQQQREQASALLDRIRVA